MAIRTYCQTSHSRYGGCSRI